MKLSKETQNIVKEIARKHNLNEFGFFKSLVKQAMFRKALKDKEFVKLAKQVDSSMERIAKKVKDMFILILIAIFIINISDAKLC